MDPVRHKEPVDKRRPQPSQEGSEKTKWCVFVCKLIFFCLQEK